MLTRHGLHSLLLTPVIHARIRRMQGMHDIESKPRHARARANKREFVLQGCLLIFTLFRKQ
jgi:hypothetical protein